MLFAKEKINTGRQSEMDLSRGFSALLLIICHVGLYIGNASNRAVYIFADIIGSEPCAPIFMALMGAGVVYSKRQEPKQMLFRGIQLFLGGYLLSAFRTLLPRLIFGNIDDWTSFDAFFVVDIFQFAGLTFMLLALCKKLKLPAWSVFLFSAVMVIVGQVFITNPPDIKNKYLIYFANLFIPITEWSCFPFLTWFFFPAFGLIFGEVLIRCRNKKTLYGILLPVSLAGVLYVYRQFYRFFPDYAKHYYYGKNYYYMGMKNVLLTALFITCSLSFWHFTENILPGFIKRFLTFLSRNLTVFYVFSWIFISACVHVSTKLSIAYGSVITMIFMVIITAISCFATLLYLFLKKKFPLLPQRNNRAE